MTNAVRGQIFLVDEPEDSNPPQHFYLVISNNGRNRALPNVLALMVTTTDKSGIATAIELTPEDRPLTGWVVADNIYQLWDDELTRPRGYISRGTMRKIESALKVALSLS